MKKAILISFLMISYASFAQVYFITKGVESKEIEDFKKIDGKVKFIVDSVNLLIYKDNKLDDSHVILNKTITQKEFIYKTSSRIKDEKEIYYYFSRKRKRLVTIEQIGSETFQIIYGRGLKYNRKKPKLFDK